MIDPFAYVANPGRVVFGSGTIEQLPAEAERLGLKRVIVLSTPHQEDAAQALSDRLGSLSAGLYAPAVMHVPVEVTERAMERRAARGLMIGDGP